MLADVIRVYPEVGSVGQDGTVLHGAKRDSGDVHLTLWPTITENRPSTKSVKISFSTFYSIAIVRCQNILYNAVNGLYYTPINRAGYCPALPHLAYPLFSALSRSVPCTAPSYPTHGARRNILFLEFHKNGCSKWASLYQKKSTRMNAFPDKYI